MALHKSKTLPNGVTGDYWKITLIELDTRAMTLRCRISLFLSHDAAASNHSLGLVKNFLFGVTNDQSISNLIALGYSLIKTDTSSLNLIGSPKDPDLAGATDV